MTPCAGAIGVETIVRHGGDYYAIAVHVNVPRGRPGPREIDCVAPLRLVAARG